MGLWNSNYHSFSLDWHEEKQFHWLFGPDLSHPLACPMYHTEDALPSNLCQNKVGGAVPKSEITHSSGKHTSSCCTFWFGKNSPGFRFCMSIRGCLKFEGSDWNCKSGPTRGSMPSQSTWPCGRRGCRPPPPAMDRSGGGCLRGPRLGTSSYSPPAPPPNVVQVATEQVSILAHIHTRDPYWPVEYPELFEKNFTQFTTKFALSLIKMFDVWNFVIKKIVWMTKCLNFGPGLSSPIFASADN